MQRKSPGLRSVTMLAVAIAIPVVGMSIAHAEDDSKVIRVKRDFPQVLPELYKPNEFIVVLNRESRRQVQVGTDRFGAPTANLPSIQQAIRENGVERFARQFPTAKPRAIDSKYPDLTGHFKARIGGGDLDRAMRAFERNPHVDHVEKIGIHFVSISPNDTYYDNPPQTFPNDQWHYWDANGIDADLAWDTTTGSSSVIVAIADSGVRYFHIDLGGNNAQWGPDNPQTNGNIFVNPNEIPGNGVDDDANGRVDDTIGYDFVASAACGVGCSCIDDDCGVQDNDPDDYDGHGTHVAGTVGAISNNNRQVAGVAGGFSDGTTSGAGNGVKILPLRIGATVNYFGQTVGIVFMDYAAEAMNYVADLVEAGHNVASFNASWGSSNTGGIDAAVDNLLAHDVMLMHAAGNSNANDPGYLGNKAGVMNVTATGRTGSGASFTNYGAWTDLAAPGVDILSTYRVNSDPDPASHYIAVLDGTSMSSPHAAGVAALLESCDPGLTGPQKFALMVNNVTSYSDARDLGSGILNAKLALDAAGCGGCGNNADCDDGDACNGAETCVGGSCQSGTPVNCDDSDACTADSCDPGTGACSNVTISCDDGNDCTTDTCDSVTGCSSTPIDCDDGLTCNGTETCSGGVCQSGTALDCDDADPCTIDSCVEPDGCLNDPITCPVGETCVGGVCEPQVCNNNGTCDSGEDCTNCGTDCISGTASGASCGNGVCEAGDGEDCVSCPQDCDGVQNGKPSNRYCCGFGGENPVGCGDARCNSGGNTCTETPVGGGTSYCCGDTVCEGDEDSGNCAIDCGAPAFCGDGTCDPGEDECNCSADCGAPAGSETSCTDGVDNDCDGLTDCDDSECAGDPVCSCGGNKAPCSSNADCCSGNCGNNGQCKGN